jgi:hypothetical protein
VTEKVKNSNQGMTWSYENFTTDDSSWSGFPEAVYIPESRTYVLTWRQDEGDMSQGSNLYLGLKAVGK